MVGAAAVAVEEGVGVAPYVTAVAVGAFDPVAVAGDGSVRVPLLSA
jgi:hypothetical protein